MKIEDEQDLKDAVSEAEAEFASIADKYYEADEKLAEARKQLEIWYSYFG